MFIWTFWWATVSLVLIILIHYLYTYMKNTFTVPIVDDAVMKNKKRYEDMFNQVSIPVRKEISDGNKDNSVLLPDPDIVDTPNINSSMKDELQSFLNTLNNTVTTPPEEQA